MSQLKFIPTRKTPFPFLESVDFATFADLLDADKASGLHKIIRPAGRETDLEEMRLSLMSANTNSVWLHGEDGVGKTALVSGLLQKIAHKEVTAALLGRQVYIFNAHNFFTGNPREALDSFNKALEFMSKQPSLLVFQHIDNFMTTANGDATFYANALVESLNESNMQAIVTSLTRNRKILDDASTAFAASFVDQIVAPADKAISLAALRAHRPRLERAHEVIIPEDAIQETMRLLERYPGRAFTTAWPEGPLALLDKTSASVRMSRYALAPDVVNKTEELWQLTDELSALNVAEKPNHKRIAEIEAQMTLLKAEIAPQKKLWEEAYQPFFKAQADIANTEKEVGEIVQRAKPPETLTGDAEKDKPVLSPADRRELSAARELLAQQRKAADGIYSRLTAQKPVVARSDIQNVFSRAAKMTLADISGDERAKLLDAENRMGKSVFGQPRAIRAVADILRAARTGTVDPNRPAGVILLLGPTGTGKTELTKVLAEVDGGEGAKPITIRMNQFKEESNITQFKGADPGNIGYSEEGPPVMRDVRKKPRSIVLMDEVEKAHESFFDVNMEILDEGVTQDSAGNEVSFRDSIIVMTSNILLPEDLAEYDIDWKDQDAVQTALRDALKKKVNPKTGRPYFKPEFVERIDQIMMFDYLSSVAAENILRKEIAKQNKTLEGRNYRLECDDDTVTRMVGTYFKAKGNGRTVRQFYNRLIRPKISDAILRDDTPPADGVTATLAVTFHDDKVELAKAMPERSAGTPALAAPLSQPLATGA